MAIPQTRADFKAYCLRRVGAPVTQINVDDDQIEDRIDDALQYYWDYHYDGVEKQYYKYQVQAQDITNQYVTLPSNIIGVNGVFPVGSSLSTNNLFNIRYQIALNDLYDLTNTTMVPYYMAMEHIQFLEQMLVGLQPVRYNRRTQILYIDMDWTIVNVGDYIVVESYMITDPDVYSGVWGDRWLQKYATALIKQQWGTNLSKFTNVPLPGGNKFNADKIYNDATAEIEKMEDQMIKMNVPFGMLIG